MATSNFNLLQLSGSDTAGYNSINALITDIDNKLYARVAVPGMIIIWQSAAGAVPTGWQELTSSTTPTLATMPSLSAGLKWIKKV